MLLSVMLGAALAAETPKLPFSDKGACPFECCTYRDWKTESPVALHAEPLSQSPVVAKIAARTTVTALTGVVITRQYGVTKILQPTPITTMEGDKTLVLRLKPGDKVYTLHAVGEGNELFWHRGKTYEAEVSDEPVGTALSSPDYVWWAKIKTRDGKIGWTSQTRDFSNQDSCG